MMMRFLATSSVVVFTISLSLAISVKQNSPQSSDTDPTEVQCTKNFEIISHDASYQRLYACIGNTIVPLRCRHCLRTTADQFVFQSPDPNMAPLTFRTKEQGCLVVCGDNTNGVGQIGQGSMGGFPGFGGLGNQSGGDLETEQENKTEFVENCQEDGTCTTSTSTTYT